MRIHELLSEKQFKGSRCTKDCSGHKAGYAWAKARGEAAPCDSNNKSFNNGCYIAKNGKVKRPFLDVIRGRFNPQAPMT